MSALIGCLTSASLESWVSRPGGGTPKTTSYAVAERRRYLAGIYSTRGSAMHSAAKQLSLMRANASIRRGARQCYIVVPLFAALLGAGAYQFLPANAPAGARWAVVLFTAALAILLMLDGHRWSRLRLTELGIEHHSLDPMVRWSELVAVSSDRTWLRLQDQMGRTASVKLLYVSSPNEVLAAVRAHTPPGVPIATPPRPWRDPGPPSPARAAAVEPDDAYARAYRLGAILIYMLPLWFVAMALLELPEQHSTVLTLLIFIHFGAINAVFLTLAFWRCPHCGKPYMGGWNARRSVALNQRWKWPCANCGLFWE